MEIPWSAPRSVLLIGSHFPWNGSTQQCVTLDNDPDRVVHVALRFHRSGMKRWTKQHMEAWIFGYTYVWKSNNLKKKKKGHKYSVTQPLGWTEFWTSARSCDVQKVTHSDKHPGSFSAVSYLSYCFNCEKSFQGSYYFKNRSAPFSKTLYCSYKGAHFGGMTPRMIRLQTVCYCA